VIITLTPGFYIHNERLVIAIFFFSMQSGWHKGKPRDMSKYKSLDRKVPATPNNLRASFKRMLHKVKPVTEQVLPHTKSFAGNCFVKNTILGNYILHSNTFNKNEMK
jgi:hypothetical protein